MGVDEVVVVFEGVDGLVKFVLLMFVIGVMFEVVVIVFE